MTLDERKGEGAKTRGRLGQTKRRSDDCPPVTLDSKRDTLREKDASRTWEGAFQEHTASPGAKMSLSSSRARRFRLASSLSRRKSVTVEIE
jgi:hypothetical protein